MGTGEALGGPEPAGAREAGPPITGNHREVAGGHQGVGGGRSSDAGRDNTTRRGQGPLLHRRACWRERIGECPVRARSTARADGLDASRALQRVLYRSAKQQPDRRFHALYDKVARSDILWEAWVGVATNGGAPGVDGVSIDAIRDGGVEGVRAFLDGLAVELREKRYRPQPLRRVHISKPGKPGEFRPLGIPTVPA